MACACQNRDTKKGAEVTHGTDADTEIVPPSWLTARAFPTLQIDFEKKKNAKCGWGVRDELQKFGDQATGTAGGFICGRVRVQGMG